MEDVWCDRKVDVYERQRRPERVNDRLDSIISTGGMKGAYIVIGQSISLDCFCIVTGREPIIVPKLVARDLTFRAFSVIRTSHQDLFRVVANEIGQNGMAPAPGPIPTHHR